MREVADNRIELVSVSENQEWSEPADVENKDWGHALTALVSANQDVIVRCPWMGGAEVTLGAAMTAYDWPPDLTAKDEPFLISVVNELLANQVRDTEEDAEETTKESEPEEDTPAKDKSTLVKQELEKPPEPRAKEAPGKVEDLKHSLPVQNPKATSDRPRPAPAEAESLKSFTNDPAESLSLKPKITSAAIQKTREKIPTPKPQDVLPIQQLDRAGEVPSPSAPEQDLKNQEPTIAMSSATANSITEGIPARSIEPARDNLDTLKNKSDRLELTPQSLFEISENFSKEKPLIDQPYEDNLEIHEETPIFLQELPKETVEPTGEVWLGHSAENSEVSETMELEVETPGSDREISLAYVEHLNSLEQISEITDAAKLELNDGFAEIVEKTVEIATFKGHAIEIIEEAEEELEELWIRLLEKGQIDYTPELLESLIAIGPHIYQKKQVSRESANEAKLKPAEYGTHEVINDLLKRLFSLQRAAAAHIIGKSAIELYSRKTQLMGAA